MLLGAFFNSLPNFFDVETRNYNKLVFCRQSVIGGNKLVKKWQPCIENFPHEKWFLTENDWKCKLTHKLNLSRVLRVTIFG